MTHYYNLPEEEARRRQLRNNMPVPEVILWSRLKGRQMLGYKFRRQFSVSQYVFDFYCPELKLALELDGESHFVGKGQEHDRQRDQCVKRCGIATVRIPNREVRRNLNGVLEHIAQIILERAKQAPPYPPHPSDPPCPPFSRGGEQK